MITHDTPHVICPHCGKKNNASTPVGRNKNAPTPGDITLCIGCGKVGVFTEDGSLRVPNAEEALRFMADPRIIQAQVLISSRSSTKKGK
jgi:hypothetical protein